ncbi:MAG: transposase [Oscillospiraceae bacterium]|jgi:transposase|nr:transposase [Oscillospiraceae bacterium]
MPFAKNQTIKEKRLNQQCKVFHLKLHWSHLSRPKREYLKLLFLEKKWLRNHILAQEDVFDLSLTKLKSVQIKVKDNFESRELNNLSSQMKQSIFFEIGNNIKALSNSKNNGNNIGKLKFVSECNMLELVQNEITYKLRGNYLYLQGFKGSFKINGAKQIPLNADLANAKLIRKPSGIYLYVTCYVDKLNKQLPDAQIGLDFGIKDNIIDSNGNKYNWQFNESDRLKRASRKLNRNWQRNKLQSNLNQKPKSKKQEKIYRLEFEKLSNRKKDAKNKFCSWLKNNHNLIAIQDENLHEWKSSKMKGWGKRVHHSIMGGIISDIKSMPHTTIIDKWHPTTQLCPNCGLLNKHSLDKRIYSCECCNYSEDRDTHSAKNIKQIGINHRLSLSQMQNWTVGDRPYLDEAIIIPRAVSFENQMNLLGTTPEAFD